MDKKRKRILNLLEEGHITAEEADRLLEDLEEDRSKHDDYFGTRFKDEVRSFSEGVKHLIDDTVQRFKEGPFEFNFSHSLVRRSFTFQTSDVKNLNVDLTHTTLKFLPAESDEISVNCKAKVFKEEDSEKAEEFFNQEFHIELINDTLNI